VVVDTEAIDVGLDYLSLVFTGTPRELLASETSLTGEYLRRYRSA